MDKEHCRKLHKTYLNESRRTLLLLLSAQCDIEQNYNKVCAQNFRKHFVIFILVVRNLGNLKFTYLDCTSVKCEVVFFAMLIFVMQVESFPTWHTLYMGHSYFGDDVISI